MANLRAPAGRKMAALSATAITTGKAAKDSKERIRCHNFWERWKCTTFALLKPKIQRLATATFLGYFLLATAGEASRGGAGGSSLTV